MGFLLNSWTLVALVVVPGIVPLSSAASGRGFSAEWTDRRAGTPVSARDRQDGRCLAMGLVIILVTRQQWIRSPSCAVFYL